MLIVEPNNNFIGTPGYTQTTRELENGKTIRFLRAEIYDNYFNCTLLSINMIFRKSKNLPLILFISNLLKRPL